MSYFDQQFRKGLSARRPMTPFLVRMRQNFALKVISLVSSILLYFFVQTERNPFIPHNFNAAILAQNVSPELQVQFDRPQFLVTITGPGDIVDHLTDQDIHVVVNIKDDVRDSTKFQAVRGHYEIEGLDKKLFEKLTFEPAEPSVKYQVFTSLVRHLPLHPIYPKDPPANYEYGPYELSPLRADVSVRSDKVKSVFQLIVDATHTEPAARIEGEFPIVAHDKDDNIVEGITITPATAHLVVPIMVRLPSKKVPISPHTTGLPVPPYSIASITVTPSQVQIIGRTDILDAISTVETEIIPVGDLTETQEITAHLILPGTYSIRDMTGRPLDTVKVRIEIVKQDTPAPPKTDGTKPPQVPKPAPDISKTKPDIKTNVNP